MAAVFETQIFTKKVICIEHITAFMKTLNVELVAAHVIDDWDYSNQQTIDLRQSDQIISLIEQKKIIIIEGKIGTIACGCFISKIDDTKYDYNFWVSTDIHSGLCEDRITDENSVVYSTVSEIFTKHQIFKDLIVGAMGVEISVTDCSDIGTMVSKSSGVVRWIIPKERNVTLRQYKEEEHDNFKIYSIY